jgi:hypothetical protein
MLQIAKSSGLKKSDVTRMAIRKFLEEYSGDENTDLYSKAKHLVGVVESGISDLGQNHLACVDIFYTGIGRSVSFSLIL